MSLLRVGTRAVSRAPAPCAPDTVFRVETDRGNVPIDESGGKTVSGATPGVPKFEPRGGSTHSAFAPHTWVRRRDDAGHEERDGRRRGLPSEAPGGRYATHCWALTRPLGRLGRHRLVSGGAIAQQWLVQELREHLVGHHLLRRAREPRPLRLPLLLLLLLLLLPLPLLLLLRGPVATGVNEMRRRALRRRRATATRTGRRLHTHRRH